MHLISTREIAGVIIQIKCSEPAVLIDEEPFYADFVTPDIKPNASKIEVILDFSIPPETNIMRKIFDSEESWSMFRKEKDYFISLQPKFSEHPFWIARMSSDATEITVFCSDNLISYQNGVPSLSNPVRYPLDQIILMYYFSRKDGALIHASGIEIKNNGYIFAGRSGAGKTTISRQFIAKNYHSLLSDDRVIVRKIGSKFRIFGTPWPGEGGIASNTSLPLSGIFFLTHGDSNRIEELNPREALERLLPVVSIPWYDAETMTHILSFCETLISDIPVYTLYFRPDTEVVDVLEKFLSH